jgi:hypothetical protein
LGAGSSPSDDEELLSPEEEEDPSFDFAAALAALELRGFFGGGGAAEAPAEFPGILIWPSAAEPGALRFVGVEPGALQARTLRTTMVSHGAEAACAS